MLQGRLVQIHIFTRSSMRTSWLRLWPVWHTGSYWRLTWHMWAELTVPGRLVGGSWSKPDLTQNVLFGRHLLWYSNKTSLLEISITAVCFWSMEYHFIICLTQLILIFCYYISGQIIPGRSYLNNLATVGCWSYRRNRMLLN